VDGPSGPDGLVGGEARLDGEPSPVFDLPDRLRAWAVEVRHLDAAGLEFIFTDAFVLGYGTALQRGVSRSLRARR
jgi:hypothetical protein